jgi:predicted transcriptional regulator of viral defense system
MDKDQLRQFPYFTGKMLKAFLGKKHPAMTLTRWKKDLIVIEKGKYTLQTDPLSYATTLVTPSYCSYRSALSYYQLTNQIPIKIQVATKKYKRPLQAIEFIQTKYMFGYTRVTRGDFDLFIAEKEKLLLDCLMHPVAGVMPSELSEVLKEPLNKEKLEKYLLRINDINLIKRAGFLLEKAGVDIYSAFKTKIRQSKNYPRLTTLLPKTGNIDSKWRLDVNEEVIL